MQKPKSAVMNRLGGLGNQMTRRIPKVEYVNRAGERVNPNNGKPYSRLVTARSSAYANGSVKKRKHRGLKNTILPIKTVGIIFGGLTPIPTNPTIDPPPRVCYNCWQPGHERKGCSRPTAISVCNNCGRRGEDLTTCPRCQAAHVKYMAYLRGEKLEQEDLEALFPNGHKFVKNGDEPAYIEDKPLDEELQQLLEPNERDFHDYNELEREAMYTEPLVKYVETREYVKNPVSRYHHSRESEEEEEARRRRYDGYEERERSYDERDREEFPCYRERESSEDRSLERFRRGNTSYAESDSDPVQDVLQLAKSIAHLSPETQELIMKQVMAERKEKARLRAMQHTVDEDWP